MWPLHIFQISTWLIGILDTLYFFGEVLPYMRYIEMVIIFAIIYFILALVVIVLDILTTISDPTDPIIYEERLRLQREMATCNSEGLNEVKEKLSKHTKVDTRDYLNSECTFVCDICLTHVQNRTKHCRECNRCVSQFDHHCKWLNNCIGDRNYKKFIVLISFYFISNVFLFTIFLIHLSNIIQYWKNPISQYYSSIIQICTNDCSSEADRYIMLIICCTMIILKFACIMFNGHLICFHIWLYCTKQTTYEWVLKRKKSMKIHNNDDFGFEDDLPNSQRIMSNEKNKPSSLHIYRSKIVHKQ